MAVRQGVGAPSGDAAYEPWARLITYNAPFVLSDGHSAKQVMGTSGIKLKILKPDVLTYSATIMSGK